jgi:hypothetical protein
MTVIIWILFILGTILLSYIVYDAIISFFKMRKEELSYIPKIKQFEAKGEYQPKNFFRFTKSVQAITDKVIAISPEEEIELPLKFGGSIFEQEEYNIFAPIKCE